MYIINTNACILCQWCVDLCPSEAIIVCLVGTDSGVGVNDIFIDQEICTQCGYCLDECPIYAIENTGDEGGVGGGTGDDPGDWEEDPPDEGGGGEVTPIPAKAYSEQPGDVFCKEFITDIIPVQVINTCVTFVIEYIENEFCDGSTNEGYYILDYYESYGILVYETGVSYENVHDFVNRHFNVEIFSNFSTAIDNGWIVMTDIPSDIDNSVHNVAVVGYRTDGTLIYIDPMKGVLQEWNVSNFNQNYAIPISSCK